MAANFDQAFKYLMQDEGGYSNVSGDHGGPTSWGITQQDLARWRKGPVNAADVKNLTQSEAKEIYTAFYWGPLGLDDVDDYGKACCIFDLGVVCGIYTAAIWAQSACNKQGAVLSVDGHIGPKSLAAINLVDRGAFIRAMAGYAEMKFKGIAYANPQEMKFLRGWMNRAERLLTLI